MGLKKIYHIFQKEKQTKQTSPGNQPSSTSELATAKKLNQAPTQNYDKAVVEQFKLSLQTKLKDPQIAKKAAEILSAWINQNSQSKSKK